MPYAVSNDGVELYFEEAGSGHALIFVHEFAGDWRSWEPQMRFFSRLLSVRYFFRTRISAFDRAGRSVDVFAVAGTRRRDCRARPPQD
jgi:pimeloyl-ACP methyl ester carboxylesterase